MIGISPCNLCPRMCGADRGRTTGRCGAGSYMQVSHVMLHHWEEPPISGNDQSRGSGTIFFTHCPLGCAYCQNGKISRRESSGQVHTSESLAGVMLKLQEDGAYNINCVSPTQYTVQIIEAVKIAREKGLELPIVWNTGGYERGEVIEMLRDTVDIFLTDFKYASEGLSEHYSSAADYPEFASASLRKMYEITGRYKIGEDGMMRRGVIVRHLVLPSHKDDSIAVLNKIAEAVPTDEVLLSLMAQYTPEFLPTPDERDKFAKIRRKVTSFEYEKVVEEAARLGFEGFSQERSSATKRFTPDF